MALQSLHELHLSLSSQELFLYLHSGPRREVLSGDAEVPNFHAYPIWWNFTQRQLFSPGGPPASGTLHCSQGAAESPGRSRKSCCPSVLAGRQRCPGLELEGSDTAPTMAPTAQCQGALSTPCCCMVQSQTSEVL